MNDRAAARRNARASDPKETVCSVADSRSGPVTKATHPWNSSAIETASDMELLLERSGAALGRLCQNRRMGRLDGRVALIGGAERGQGEAEAQSSSPTAAG
ncbi:MAG: hypothetical protein CL931_05365 [Deltaproteobacteria bacterium]|nr:hypothetical protein [Deltaproteobacteria bacterium]